MIFIHFAIKVFEITSSHFCDNLYFDVIDGVSRLYLQRDPDENTPLVLLTPENIESFRMSEEHYNDDSYRFFYRFADNIEKFEKLELHYES